MTTLKEGPDRTDPMPDFLLYNSHETWWQLARVKSECSVLTLRDSCHQTQTEGKQKDLNCNEDLLVHSKGHFSWVFALKVDKLDVTQQTIGLLFYFLHTRQPPSVYIFSMNRLGIFKKFSVGVFFSLVDLWSKITCCRNLYIHFLWCLPIGKDHFLGRPPHHQLKLILN